MNKIFRNNLLCEERIVIALFEKKKWAATGFDPTPFEDQGVW
ncbi:MAG TPA: hypothetical protein VJP79_11955 [Nitrososphaera sp.]|nr:hypothetical protein [Nitrososphaera sp.]